MRMLSRVFTLLSPQVRPCMRVFAPMLGARCLACGHTASHKVVDLLCFIPSSLGSSNQSVVLLPLSFSRTQATPAPPPTAVPEPPQVIASLAHSASTPEARAACIAHLRRLRDTALNEQAGLPVWPVLRHGAVIWFTRGRAALHERRDGYIFALPLRLVNCGDRWAFGCVGWRLAQLSRNISTRYCVS